MNNSQFQSGVISIIANMMTTASDMKEIRDTFKRWDSDGSGTISADELTEHMAEIAQFFNMGEREVREVIKAADTDNDGQIDYNEFSTAALDKKKHITQDNLRKAFKMFDQDNDGKVTPNEL